MDRRKFNRLCSSLLAGASSLSLSQRATFAAAEETGDNAGSDNSTVQTVSQLVHESGDPVSPDSLVEGRAYVFHYPYRTTPCFLIKLSPSTAAASNDSAAVVLADRNGVAYEWQGGVGPGASIVAFSAICTHKMSHPARPVSHLNFRPEQKVYFDRTGEKQTASQLIYCCSEHSVYDPAAGAKVLSGPASQPLAAIQLQLSRDDKLSATAMYGGDMVGEFLERFGFRQAMEQGISDPYTSTGPQATIIDAENYSELQILC